MFWKIILWVFLIIPFYFTFGAMFWQEGNKTLSLLIYASIPSFYIFKRIVRIARDKQNKAQDEKQNKIVEEFLAVHKSGNAVEVNISNFIKDNDERIYFVIENAKYINNNGREADAGKAFVSDKRFVFLGNNATHTFEYKNILRTGEQYLGFKLQSKKDKVFRTYTFEDILEYKKIATLFNFYYTRREQ